MAKPLPQTQESFEMMLNKTAELVAVNAHTEALQEIAEYFEYKSLEAIITKINEMQMLIGHLPPELSSLKHQYYEQLLECIGNDFGEDIRKLVYNQL